MRPLTANLMPLLQTPAFALWHILGALVCIPAVVYPLNSPAPSTGGYLAAFLVPVWSGLLMASMQRDFLLPPFAVGLPDHQSVLRRTLFLTGLVTSLVAGLTVLAYPGLDAGAIAGVFWSAFCCGLICFLLVAAPMFLVDHAMVSLGPVMAGCFALLQWPDLRVRIQEAALFSPVWNTLLVAVVATLMWRRLGNPALARRLCGKRFLSLQRFWIRTPHEALAAEARREILRRGESPLRRRLRTRWLAQMSRLPPLSLRRYLASTRYELLNGLLPASSRMTWSVVLLFLIVLVIAGYKPPPADQPAARVSNAVYFVSILAGMYLGIPLFTSMLLPVGRRDRFLGALTVAACNGLVVLGLSLLLYSILFGLSLVAPPLSLWGGTYSFQAAELKPIYFPLVLLPLDQVLKLTCRRWLLIPEVLLFGAGSLILMKAGPAVSNLGAVGVIAWLVATWAILIGTLHHYSFRRDLVQG